MSNINPLTTVSVVDTSSAAKSLTLPYSILVLNKTITIKDYKGFSSSNSITITTYAGDTFENGTSNYVINTNYGFATFLALSNKWSLVTNDTNVQSIGISSIYTQINSQNLIYNDGTTTQVYTGSRPNFNIFTLFGKTALYYAYGNNTWVASVIGTNVSNSLYYSYDGLNWSNSIITPATLFPSSDGRINFVTYQNNQWVGLVTPRSSALGTTRIIYSTDGVTWQLNTSKTFNNDNMFSAAYGNGLWILVGSVESGSNIFRTTDITGGTFVAASNGIFNSEAGKSISFNNNIWIATGNTAVSGANKIIQYSTDGSNWRPASNTTTANTRFFDYNLGGTSIAYKPSLWIVGGYQSNATDYSIYQSTDGSNFSAIRTTTTSNIQAIYNIVYNPGNTNFYALAQYNNAPTLITSANNCSNWSVIAPFTLTNPLQRGLAIGNLNTSYSVTNVYTNTVVANNISAEYFYGDGSRLSNTGIAGISSLSTVVSYGLSSIGGLVSPGISSLSSIVSYGLSSIGGLVSPGISSLSSILSYGLSTIARSFIQSNDPSSGISSLSTVVSYGLSTVFLNDRLRTNNWVSPFHASTIGGTDIYDASTGNPDTYTVGLAKLDNWLYKNIVDQPPAPSYAGIASDVYSVKYAWSNIFQFKIGLFDMYVPHISSIQLDLYSNANSVNCNLMSSFLFSRDYIPYGTSNFEVIEFNNSNPTLFNYYIGGSFPTKKTLAIGISDSRLNQTNQPYSLDVTMRNYSSNIPSVLRFAPQSMGSISPPSAPGASLGSPGITSMVVSITKPSCNASNLTATPNYPNLFGYRIVLCNTAAQPSRFGNTTIASLVATCNITYSANPQDYTITNLNADTQYLVNVSARNVANINYGAIIISGTNTTLPPDPPGTISNISPLNNPSFYTTVGEVVFTGTHNLSVYDRNAANFANGLSFVTNAGLGIHSLTTRGVSGDNVIASFNIATGSNSIIAESNTTNLKGFATPTHYPNGFSNVTRTNTIVSASNIMDFYSSDSIRSNFYLSFTGRGTLLKDYLLASVTPYTFSFTHSNRAGVTNLSYGSNIYVDDLTVAPTLSGFSNTSNTYALYISGVPVYSYSNTISFDINISNLARFYYISGQKLIVGSLNYGGSQLLSLSCNTNATFFDNTNAIQTTAPVKPISRFKFSHIFSGSSRYTTTGGLVNLANLQLSNLKGTNTIATSNTGIYFDGPSQLIMEVQMSNARAPGGERYLSDGSSPPTTVPNTTYDNKQLIIGNSGSANYNFELPLVGGLFQTGASLGTAYDTITTFQQPTGLSGGSLYSGLTNYNTIKDETGTRYATFKYSFSNSLATPIVSLQITFNNLTGLSVTAGASNPYSTVAVPYFKYRVDNVGSLNTPWLNANNLQNGVSPFSPSVAVDTGGVLSNKPISNAGRYLSIVSVPTRCNYDIYMKIGLKMNCNISFSGINIVPRIIETPPAVTVTYAIVGANLTMNWSEPENPGTITQYVFSNIACNSDGTYPRRYGRAVIQEPNLLRNTCNNTGTTYSFSAPYSNFDTYYTEFMFASNAIGPGDLSSATTGPTDLPTIEGSGFGNNLRNVMSVSYSRAGTLFAGRPTTSIAGTLIYNSNSLFNGAITHNFKLYNNSTELNNITVNHLNVGVGMTSVNWTLFLYRTGSLTASFNYNYPYTTFANTTINPTIVDNASFTWTNQGTADMFQNNIYKSNYYAITTPIINLKAAALTFGTSNRLLLVDSNRAVSNAVDFYLESQNVAPSGMISLSNAGGINYRHISGLNVITTNIFHFWITASNIGSYFYFNPPVTASLTNTPTNGTFVFNPASTPFYSATNETSSYTASPISNTTYFLWSNVTLTNPSQPVPTNTYTLSGTISNLFGNASLVIDTSATGKFVPYYDPASDTAMSYNTRVTSGSGFSPAAGTFGDTFDNSINIANGAYISELQLYNGGYVTKQITGSYANYTTYTQIVGSIVTNPDYSGVTTGTAIRWVTFKFASITTTNILNKVDTITFDYLYISGQPSASGTSPLGFYVSVSNIARFNNSSPFNTNDSSAWLNLNRHAATAPTIITKNTELTAGSASNTFTRSGTTDTFVVKVPDGCGYNNFDMYIRVGFSMGNSHSLQRVNNPSKTEIAVPSLFTFSGANGAFPTTIRLNVIEGLPTNTYATLSNFLYLGPSLLRTNTHVMAPTLNSYAGPSTGTDLGTQFSNRSVIYKPDGTILWENTCNFSVTGSAPDLSDFIVNRTGATGTDPYYDVYLKSSGPYIGTPTADRYYWSWGNGANGSGSNILQINTGAVQYTKIRPNSTPLSYNINPTITIYASNTIGKSPNCNLSYYSGALPTTTVTITSSSATPNTTNGSVRIQASCTATNATSVASWTVDGVSKGSVSSSLDVTIDPPVPNSLGNFNKQFTIVASVNNQYTAGTTTATATPTSAVFTLPAPTIASPFSYTYNPGDDYPSISQAITQNVSYPTSGVTTNWLITGGGATSATGTGLTVTSKLTSFSTNYTITVFNSYTGIANSASNTSTAPTRGQYQVGPPTASISGYTYTGGATFNINATVTNNGISGATVSWFWNILNNNYTIGDPSLVGRTDFEAVHTLYAQNSKTNYANSGYATAYITAPLQLACANPEVSVSFTYTSGATFVVNASIKTNEPGGTTTWTWTAGATGAGTTSNTELTGKTNFGATYTLSATTTRSGYINSTASDTETAPVQIFTGTVSGTEYARIYTIDVRRSPDGRTGAIKSGTPTITLFDSGGYLSYNYPDSSSIEVTMNDTLDPTPYFTYSVNWTT